MLIGWDRLEPAEQRPPCPHALCLVLVDRLIRTEKPQLALIIWLCFDALLRINEALSITMDDVTFPTDASQGGIRTKTGVNQSITIANPSLWNCHHPQPSGRLFPPQLTSAGVTRQIHSTCRAIGTNWGFTAHSLRHGGATEMYIQGRPMADILQRGRWRSTRTAERYIQAGRSLLLSRRLPSSVQRAGERLIQNPSTIVASLQ